jgi:hypothetical protein
MSLRATLEPCSTIAAQHAPLSAPQSRRGGRSDRREVAGVLALPVLVVLAQVLDRI